MRQKIKRLFFYSSWLFRFSIATLFCLLISIPLRFTNKYKNLWLIEERPDEARDNGYWLYKWILENKPNEKIRYVLSKKSPDYDKMPHKELIIEPSSLKHYILYILSSYSVSTHMHGACPGKAFCIPFLPFMRRKKSVFLQHGVTKNLINIRGGLDAIIAVSEEEKKILIAANPRYEGKVFVTGFCRYDQLEDLSKKQDKKIILVMPTFRKWLRDIGRLRDADNVFKKTQYYKEWNSFLNDKRISEAIDAHDAEILFFPHKEMQKMMGDFSAKNKHIHIGKAGEYDVQSLLRNASVLITDYSSVLFDFVYMNKPVVMFQFDQVEFSSKHYRSSGKPYPFGDIFLDKESLVDEVIATIERNYSIKEQYKKDAENFYKYRDKRNCERVYKLIKGLNDK